MDEETPITQNTTYIDLGTTCRICNRDITRLEFNEICNMHKLVAHRECIRSECSKNNSYEFKCNKEDNCIIHVTPLTQIVSFSIHHRLLAQPFGYSEYYTVVNADENSPVVGMEKISGQYNLILPVENKLHKVSKYSLIVSVTSCLISLLIIILTGSIDWKSEVALWTFCATAFLLSVATVPEAVCFYFNLNKPIPYAYYLNKQITLINMASALLIGIGLITMMSITTNVYALTWTGSIVFSFVSLSIALIMKRHFKTLKGLSTIRFHPKSNRSTEKSRKLAESD